VTLSCQEHCRSTVQNLKRQKRRQSVVEGKQQLYCVVQSWSPNDCRTTTEKVQSSVHNGTLSVTAHSWQTMAALFRKCSQSSRPLYVLSLVWYSRVVFNVPLDTLLEADISVAMASCPVRLKYTIAYTIQFWWQKLFRCRSACVEQFAIVRTCDRTSTTDNLGDHWKHLLLICKSEILLLTYLLAEKGKCKSVYSP